MNTYTIIPLLVAIIYKVIKPGPLFPGVPDAQEQVPIVAYLITGGDSPILVDTGPCPPDVSLKTHYRMVEDNSMLLVNRLAAHGCKPEDINTVVNTHLHWDHCYNNSLFPHADIYVQEKELEFAANPLPNQYSFYDAFQMGRTPAWVGASGRFKMIDGDYRLAEGIELVHLPGHTPGSMGVLVDTERGRHLIAGDCVPNLALWENREFGLPLPAAIHVDTAAYYKTYRKILDMEAHVIPSHDFKALEPVYPSQQS